jgi:hypothetical protein
MSVSVLVAPDTKSYEILSRIIARAAPRLDVMDLKALNTPARLAAPAVQLQNFTTELAISRRLDSSVAVLLGFESRDYLDTFEESLPSIRDAASSACSITGSWLL